MPSYLNVYNASVEPFKTQINSKGYRFLPGSLTKIPEQFDFALPQYEKHGLVVINPGDNLKAKEKQARMAYLGYLIEQRSYFRMYMDEKRRNGVTIDTPRRLQEIEQLIEELTDMYKNDDSFLPVKSFKDLDPIDEKKLFAGEVQVNTVEELVRRKPGRPKSFKEINIEEEIKN